MADAVGVGLEVESRAEDIPSAAWRLLELIAGLLIGAITVLVTVQVFARYVLNDTPPWSEELCRYLFIWVVVPRRVRGHAPGRPPRRRQPREPAPRGRPRGRCATR